MAAPERTERLRFTPRSIVIAVALLGLALLVVRVFLAAHRVVGWVLVAAILAGLLYPLVEVLAKRVPRGLAVAIVALSSIAGVAVIAYGAVDEVVDQGRRLQRAAPRVAEDLERSERFGETARDLDLVQRTRQFVNGVPERLRGGTPSEALRSATDRVVAFLATFVLTIFLLVHGPRLARGALKQIGDDARRARVEQVASGAYWRAWRYVAGSLVMATAAGVVGYALARVADVPGALVLGLWTALWDLVPVLGVVVGAGPIIGFAAVDSTALAIVVAVALLAFQAVEAVVIQRWVERRSLHLGPFLTVAGGLIGLEIYGLGGAVVTVVLLALAVGVTDELAA